MRKVILIILSIIFLCFLIPAIFTKGFKSEQVTSNNLEVEPEKEEVVNDYNYSQYNTVKVLHTADNIIEEIGLDEYLLGVVAAEMPANFELEALKAQAVVARTYTLFKIIDNGEKTKHPDANICDDITCCQAWISKEDRFSKWEESERENNWNKISDAVNSTKGDIILYQNQVINALFHSNSGGTTEIPINVWGGSNYPYLQTVQTSGEDTYSQYKSEAEFTKDELVNKIKEIHKDFTIEFSQPECIKILEYTEGGRIKTIKFGNIEMSGVEVRTLLGLKSANFNFVINEDKIKFEVTGYGHGVGMSQTGADALAKEGKNYIEIITHFYKDVEVKKEH